jgi:hypothetical protein
MISEWKYIGFEMAGEKPEVPMEEDSLLYLTSVESHR